MDALLQIGLTNAVMATVLAILAALASKLCRRPAVAHALWLLVLLKLLTPPLLWIPIDVDEPELEQEFVEAAIDRTEPAEDVIAPASVTPNSKPKHGRWKKRHLPPTTVEPSEPVETIQTKTGPIPDDPTSSSTPLRGLTPPAQTVPSVEVPEATMPVAEEEVEGETQIHWFSVAMALWITGSVTWFAVALTRIGRFRRLLGAWPRCAAGIATGSELAGDEVGADGLPQCLACAGDGVAVVVGGVWLSEAVAADGIA